MMAGPQSTSRQAALLLHAMCEADRKWLLLALPDEQRQALKGLLAELHELGIPPQQGFVEQTVAPVGAPPGETDTLGSNAMPRALLDNLDVPQIDALARLLRGEPALLVAHLLRSRAWAWQPAVLAQLGAVQRRQVQDALQDLSLPGATVAAAALQAALVTGLERRLADEPPPPYATRAALPALQGLRLRVNRWRGSSAGRPAVSGGRA